MTGGCTCGQFRYRLRRAPLFVHCCHCTQCQRLSGAAFALNALIEEGEVETLEGHIERVDTPGSPGRVQPIYRCPDCRVAVWSTYSRPSILFVRVGTLDNPALCLPDIHIFTSTKLPWVALPPGALACDGFYDYEATWPADSYSRLTRATT
ncbi:GFA family protein [Rhodobacteraceae bacterium NNCM2]|nr:GFA family protein [Coraliihabitans acroporae]